MFRAIKMLFDLFRDIWRDDFGIISKCLDENFDKIQFVIETRNAWIVAVLANVYVSTGCATYLRFDRSCIDTNRVLFLFIWTIVCDDRELVHFWRLYTTHTNNTVESRRERRTEQAVCSFILLYLLLIPSIWFTKISKNIIAASTATKIRTVAHHITRTVNKSSI